MFSESLRRHVVGVSLGLGLLAGSAEVRRSHAGAEGTPADSWEYPVRLGDPRARVHELLGAATRATPELEDYPASGVTAWFDSEGRITKLNFAGDAAALYTNASFDPIVSERPVVFGLTGHTDEDGFRRALGVPARESQQRSTSVRELQCV